MTRDSGRSLVLVVCGLNGEAAIAAGVDVLVIAGGGDRATLDRRLAGIDPDRLVAVVSFGLAGALTPDLTVGMAITPTTIRDESGERYETHPDLSAVWVERLARAGIPTRFEAILGVAAPVLGASDKRRLATTSGASAVDMESHVAAAFASRHGLPFGALRVISDPSDRDLPAVVGRAMRPDGSVDAWAVVRGLAGDPGQIPGLARTARDAAVAMRRLRRVRGLLGPRLGLQL